MSVWKIPKINEKDARSTLKNNFRGKFIFNSIDDHLEDSLFNALIKLIIDFGST